MVFEGGEKPPVEALAVRRPDPHAKSLEDAAHLIGQILLQADQPCPDPDRRTKFIGVHALDLDFTEPAGPHDLGQAEGVIRIGLVQL
jgi:hypothetical protein